MKDFKLNDSEDFGIYLNFIQELGLEIGSTSENPQSCDKKYLTEFVSYSKGIAEVLKKTEDKVNEMISNIENIIESGNKKDKAQEFEGIKYNYGLKLESKNGKITFTLQSNRKVIIYKHN